MKLLNINTPTITPHQTPKTAKVETTFDQLPLSIEIGSWAQQAEQSVLVKHGNTVILTTLTDEPARAEIPEFRPLTVDYYERPGAVGQIPGNYFRREGRQTDREIQICRFVDRAVRPLFDSQERRNLQIIIQVLSADAKSDLIGLAIISAAAVAQISAIPFAGPLAGRSFCIKDGRLVPAVSNLEVAWTVASTPKGVVMLEGGSYSIETADLFVQLQSSQRDFEGVWQALNELETLHGQNKVPFTDHLALAEHPAFDACLGELAAILKDPSKKNRDRKYQELLTRLKAEVGGSELLVAHTLWELKKSWIRSEALENRRQDGRTLEQIRPYRFEKSVLPATPASVLATHGNTQLLVSLSTGAPKEALEEDGLFGKSRSTFFVHYNFPGFATNEIRHGKNVSRREVGHGLLIQGAFANSVFQGEGRVVRGLCDVLSADGATTMAAICGMSIALTQIGAISQPVVGISVGLIAENDNAVLMMDMTGDEDLYGDMDLKVAGTPQGITALHLDNKVGAIDWNIIETALQHARTAHAQLFEEIKVDSTEISAPTQIQAPPAFQQKVQVNPQRFGLILGKKGQNLKALETETNTRIRILEHQNLVVVSGDVEEGVKTAVEKIQSLSLPLKKGNVYDAVVDQVKAFGAFVKFADHIALVHVSDFNTNAHGEPIFLEQGQKLTVKLLGVDAYGRLKVTRID